MYIQHNIVPKLGSNVFKFVVVMTLTWGVRYHRRIAESELTCLPACLLLNPSATTRRKKDILSQWL